MSIMKKSDLKEGIGLVLVAIGVGSVALGIQLESNVFAIIGGVSLALGLSWFVDGRIENKVARIIEEQLRRLIE
ncbi:MAG: hypothetical protein DRP00_01415 [Candidatus Aenigmatarchaeota archaeon]|nr:MAG: hypothetical protein DRP00_01415 [Candidatus Aenigmarchaeota archaeon]